MSKMAEQIGKATERAIEEVETRILASEGRRSMKAKAGRAKSTARKAAKAAVVAGAVTAAAVVLRDRRKLKKLET
ncbi:MAG: hypothetical protein ACO3F5_07005 [Gemmatimonadaceae bacterium]|jgi:tartrate dehydratase beta subunit/fumarate hydratase class I family protein